MATRKKLSTKSKAPKRAAKAKTPPPAAEPKRVLLLRTCGAGGKAHDSFVWPLEIGAVVRPKKWDPTPACGNGLHGLLWGEGTAGCMKEDAPVWIVFSAIEADVVRIADCDLKWKVREARVEFVGDRSTAPNWLAARAPGHTVHYATATAGVRGTATAGDRGTATAGVRGTATAGDGGTATAGYGGTATAGYGGVIVIRYWDEQTQRERMKVAEVGEDGIEPGSTYRLDDARKFVRVEKAAA